MNEEESDDSYSSDSSGDENEAYAGNEVINILQKQIIYSNIHILTRAVLLAKFKRKFSQLWLQTKFSKKRNELLMKSIAFFVGDSGRIRRTQSDDIRFSWHSSAVTPIILEIWY